MTTARIPVDDMVYPAYPWNQKPSSDFTTYEAEVAAIAASTEHFQLPSLQDSTSEATQVARLRITRAIYTTLKAGGWITMPGIWEGTPTKQVPAAHIQQYLWTLRRSSAWYGIANTIGDLDGKKPEEIIGLISSATSNFTLR